MSEKFCHRCRKTKGLDQFRPTRQGVSSACASCLDARQHRERAEAQDRILNTVKTLPTLEDFYAKLEAAKEEEYLSHTILFQGAHFVRITSLGNENIVDAGPENDAGNEAYRTKADIISRQCEDILGYRWRYHDMIQRVGVRGELPAFFFRYRCAQDQQMQEKARKTTDVSKQRDRRAMAFFNCESHLHVTLQIIHSTFTAKIDLKHTDDHIPYRATQLPPEALEMIATNKEKLLKDVWQDVRNKFPNASFSRDAVYHYHRSLKMKDWKLDPDPVTSANILLRRASEIGAWDGLHHQLQVIDLGKNEDYEIVGRSDQGTDNGFSL
ncbi:uncharacterized protein EI90DRAFT_3287000 [Cantharellus anzutake]|uniref:uncharacterized protein n=1 Tax=Cantharellus anzutake TaxID=1750568 RepID=UPI001902FD7D|nr:uncharacterized protein EI90DRAFT_3287000 [Cantharellus anzutake]KAF8337362.1 hypothetical protein EI90DRAFT_3287000 [Cantharellus anzutake]